MKNKRIWELDFLRGFSIIMMVFDHIMYDLMHFNSFFSTKPDTSYEWFNQIRDLAYQYWTSDLRFWGHYFFVSVFLLVSGISFTFSKNNLSRSVKMLIVAFAITAVTGIISLVSGSNDLLIVMGVIHMFGLSTLITYLFRRFIKSDLVILLIGIAIIIVGFEIRFWEYHYVSSITFKNVFGVIIGTKAFGVDYFGIVPYLGVIMIGTVIGNQLYKNKRTLFPQVKVGDKNIVVLTGKYSIYVYLAHQVVIFILMVIFAYILGYRL